MKYKPSAEVIDARQDGMALFWKREPDFIFHETDKQTPHVDTYRFPPVDDDQAPLLSLYVYMTGGMSDLEMPGMEGFDESMKRAEITAYAIEPLMAESGESDFIANICRWMAHYPFDQKTYFFPGQTFDCGRPIIPESQMQGFYFSKIPFVEKDLLSKAIVTATSFVHLVPISRAELELAHTEGAEALLKLFREVRANPLFDLTRACFLSDD